MMTLIMHFGSHLPRAKSGDIIRYPITSRRNFGYYSINPSLFTGISIPAYPILVSVLEIGQPWPVRCVRRMISLIIFNVTDIPSADMRFPGVIIVILILLVALSGCTSPPAATTPPEGSPGTPVTTGAGGAVPASTSEPAGPTDQDLRVFIDPDILIYSPAMSSVPGIGLTPNLTGPVYPGQLRYHWQADYGHFISWNPPDFVIKDLGANVSLGREKVYWTYNATGPMIGRPPALIVLMLEDAGSGAIQAAAAIEIDWDDSGLNATVPG
jgi:hypothetical protein